MKTLIIFLLYFFLANINAQTVYEVTPGTKGNQIILSLSNISEIINAENVEVKPLHKGKGFEEHYLRFSKESQIIEKINPKEEKEVIFEFDIKREAPVNKKDTIEFMITGSKGVYSTKQFILSYTAPKDYKLEQNFPNPFNPTTIIQYQLPMDGKVTLTVYDILGSEVITLVNEVQPAGYKEIKLDASSLSSGVYIYRLVAKDYISTKKMMVVK
jgi:hypothetical protein